MMVQVDMGCFDLVSRMKSKYAALYVLPQPQVNFMGEFNIGNTGLSLLTKYEVLNCVYQPLVSDVRSFRVAELVGNRFLW